MCVRVEMAKSGQQLMAFPCIQMRKFDTAAGGRTCVDCGGRGDLDYLLPYASCRNQGRKGSVVTSAQSKGCVM